MPAPQPYLYWYMQQVQRLVGFDEMQALYNLDDLITFINIARNEVAAQGQCVRLLTPCSGSIVTLTVEDPGSGYTNPQVVISAPDAPSGSRPYPRGAQAIGAISQIGGQLIGAAISFGGAGYFRPAVTITDPTGSGGVVTAQLTPFNQTYFGQEEYFFDEIDLAPFPGIKSILAVQSVSSIWANWQWSASRVSFSKYQAQIRQYTTSFNAPPVWLCQFGQGTAGSFKLYPVPDQSYSVQWDCLCLPIDLDDDTTYEAIPEPWDKAVPFYAAHLALLSRSAEVPALLPLAMRYFNEKDGGLFGVAMRRARAFAQPHAVSSFYGRV